MKRGEAKKADYILYYKPGIPLAVIEAKDNNHSVGDGMQQALEYAEILDVPFAYSSNGDAFLEHDRTVTQGVVTRKIPNGDLIPGFLAIFVASPVIRGLIDKVQVGATREALNKGMIERFEIPIPPPRQTAPHRRQGRLTHDPRRPIGGPARRVPRRRLETLGGRRRRTHRSGGAVMTPISAIAFRRAFDRFQSIHRRECGIDLATFRDPKSFGYTEDYKENIAGAAANILGAADWSRREIGTGQIVRRVIQAIEIKGNNLLSWQPRFGDKARVHHCLYEALENPDLLRSVEAVFYDLYHDRRANQSVFEGLLDAIHPRYELIAYLFFIADRNQFLPIRTETFDAVLADLDLPLRTRNQPNWDNYQSFIGVIKQVQTCLHDEGILDATLLDAHSFCWILAYDKKSSPEADKREPTIVHREFGGTIHQATGKTPASRSSGAPVVDMVEVSKDRVAAGKVAEEYALLGERYRLKKVGRSDLAERVELVSNRPGLGYDIKSFEVSGDDRHIEVKNVSGDSRFFITAGEWSTSRTLPNYWFYLVSGVGSPEVVIHQMAADRIDENHLTPTNYRVVFDF